MTPGVRDNVRGGTILSDVYRAVPTRMGIT